MPLYTKAISKTASIVIAIIVIIVIIGVIGYYTYIVQQQAPSPTPSPTTPTTTTPTSPTTPSPTETETTTPTTPIETETTPSTTPTPTPTETETPTTSPTTTPTTTPTTPTTTPKAPTLKFGNVEVEVTKDLYEFAEKARKGEVSVQIEIWVSVMPFEEEILKKVVDEFMKEYPGIKVKLVNTPSMKEKFKAATIVGKGPDLLTWAHDWTGEFVEADLILPLDEYLTESILDVYLPAAIKAAEYKNRVWGLPWASETVALVCNKDMVPTPPKTFSELEEVMKKYYNPDKGTYGISHQVDPYFVSAWIHAFGGFYYNDTTGEVGVGSQGTIEGFKFFLDRVASYMYKDDVGHEAQLKLFIEKKTPCIVTGPWDIPKIKEAGIKFFVVPLPPIDKERIPKPYSGIKLWWMSKLTKERGTDKATVLFMLWYTLNDEIVKYLAKEAGFVPVNKYALQSPEVQSIPEVYGYAMAVRNSIPMPKSPEMAKVWGPVADAISAIWGGKASVEEAFKLAQEEILKKLGKG